jgi:hypothetical protein
MVYLATERQQRTETVREGGAGVPASPAAPVNAVAEPDPKLVVILIDDISIDPLSSKGLFVSAERFVESLPSRDWAGLASTSGRMTVNPSLDRAPLMKVLKRAFGWMDDPRMSSSNGVGLMEAVEAEDSGSLLLAVIERACVLRRSSANLGQLLATNTCAQAVEKRVRDNAAFARINTRNQFDAYSSVIGAMSSAPGVKQLVILTGGVALKPSDSLEFVPVATLAAAAGVQITMLMEEPQEDMQHGRGWVKDQRRLLQQAETLAEMSGGQLYRVVGQADRFYERVLRSASAIYRLGVDLPAQTPEDGSYHVSVTVKRQGVRVLASRWAAPPAPTTVVAPEAQMADAVTKGTLLYGVPVAINAEPVDDHGAPAIRVRIDVPGDTAGPVSGLLGFVSPDGQLMRGQRALTQASRGSAYQLDFLLPAPKSGLYQVRFAVRDATGAVGAVAQSVPIK